MSIRMPAGGVPLAAMPPGMPVAYAAPAPVLQTKDMPDPHAVAQQKDAYSKSLDQQLGNGRNQIVAENQQKKKALNDAASHQKQMYILQVDQEVKKQEMLLDQEMARKLHDLEKAAHDQRAILEQQAATLTMEYNTKKAQEQFEQQQAYIQKSYEEAHAKIHAEASKLQPPMQQVQTVPGNSMQIPTQVPVPGVPPTTAMYGALPGPSYTAAPKYAAPTTVSNVPPMRR